MTYSITDFSKKFVSYTTDDNIASAITLRTVYSNIAALGLNTAAAAGVAPLRGKPRHVYISNPGGPNNTIIRRKVPYNAGTLAAAETALASATIDGMSSWTVHGHTGERTRH